MTTLTKDIAEKFASLALAHVEREFPHKMDHVMADAAAVIGPRTAHPIFYGSFDWHSCVHGYWLLARLKRRCPDMRQAREIEALFDRAFTPANVEAECAYLRRPDARVFERPYGWGWLLALQVELEQSGEHRLAPLAEMFAQRFRDFLPLCDYPIRTGVHSSTAFALRLAADWAEAHDPLLYDLICARLLKWHAGDANAAAWEPSQDDFLSPTLMTAEALRRIMPPEKFRAWFAAYLPRAAQGEPASLFTPAFVSDRTDGKIAHLDGLNFSRAWCWRAIASALDDAAVQAKAHAAADAHINASLLHVAGDYMGEHWLATFALLALEA